MTRSFQVTVEVEVETETDGWYEGDDQAAFEEWLLDNVPDVLPCVPVEARPGWPDDQPEPAVRITGARILAADRSVR